VGLEEFNGQKADIGSRNYEHTQMASRDCDTGGISEALKLRAIVRTSLQSDLIRAAQFAIGEELRTEFQTPHELPSELRIRMEELAVRHG
jgi:hypothetical protein